MEVRSIADVLDTIGRRDARGAGVRVVGIDGPSGSGKTRLARLLSQGSGAPIVSIDDFVSWADLETWWPRFDAEVLVPLLAGRDARYQTRDWDGDEFGSSLADWKITPWNPLVIVEGVTCTRSAAQTSLAYRIWVEAPESIRLGRGLARDGESHREVWKAWMERETEFFARDQTRSRADLVVEGDTTVQHDPLHELVTETP